MIVQVSEIFLIPCHVFFCVCVYEEFFIIYPEVPKFASTDWVQMIFNEPAWQGEAVETDMLRGRFLSCHHAHVHSLPMMVMTGVGNAFFVCVFCVILSVQTEKCCWVCKLFLYLF